MAVMIPELGPQETESPGELTVYALLRRGLSDEYIVIHSLPWLCAAVRNIDKKYAPTGEIDFLVIHPRYGVLALEVKSGHYRIEGASFVRNGRTATKSPVSQIRRNVHGLTSWLGADPSLRIRFGYGFIFPDSLFGDAVNTPMLADIAEDSPQRIVVDREKMSELAARVSEMLIYWNAAGGTHALGEDRAKRLVETLCPKYDGTPSWGMRVLYDNQIWLRLTREQGEVLAKASVARRMVVTGWPGTGKTLIGSELASRSAKQGKKVLFVTFNTLLRDALQDQLSGHWESCTVFSWHALCREAQKRAKLPSDESEEWLDKGCVADLVTAVDTRMMANYDLLILDEAQALRSEWICALLDWFQQKQVVAFCDETQVFSFEHERVTLRELCAAMQVAPFNLSVVLRTPRAVTERLKACRPVNYQLFSPRPLESDSLQERTTDGSATALTEVFEELRQQGIEKEEIVVLTRLPLGYWSRHFADTIVGAEIRHEIVGRFRGVECPVVVIVDADEMDDVQLFCAYSRATSVCIALYRAEELAWKPSGKFQTSLLEDELILAQVQKAKKRSQTSTYLNNHMATFITDVQTARIAWHSEWHSWLVELGTEGDPGETWIDYLVTSYPWPVFYWHTNSRRELSLALPTRELDENLPAHWFQLQKCKKCGHDLPCRSRSENCIFCDGEFEITSGVPSEADLAVLVDFDDRVRQFAKGEISDNLLADMPVQLIAVGARLYGQRNQRRNTTAGIELRGGNLLYRIALAFILARVASMKSGTTFDRAALAKKLYDNYKTLQRVPFERWATWLSSAVSTCMNHKKLLTRVKKNKNLYSPIDPEEAEESILG